MAHQFEVLLEKEDLSITESYAASNLFPALAFDEESYIFLTDDKTLSVVFECSPLVGANENIHLRTANILSQSYPENTIINFFWFKSPDYESYVDYAESLREDASTSDLVKEVFHDRITYVEKLKDQPIPFVDGYVHDQKLLVTMKIPFFGDIFGEKDIEKTLEFAEKLEGALTAAQLQPFKVDAEHYIHFMQTVLNWGENAGWRSIRPAGGGRQFKVNKLYDELSPICDQILDLENDIEVTDESIRIGKKFIKVMSAKRYPDAMFFGDMLGACGDLSGTNMGIKNNYFVSTTVYFPDYTDTKLWIENRRNQVVFQAHGPLLKFIPILADKLRGFNALYDSLNEGHKPVKVATQIGIFCDSDDEAKKVGEEAVSFFNSRRFKVMSEDHIRLIALKEALPMGCNWENIKPLNRHKTMTSEQAIVLLPIFSEWKGTGTPHMSLFSRNGQVMSVSLHDTGSNKNGVIIAPSGSGKSFLANEMIFSYLSEGAQVWTIDVGRSYEKLCESVGGQFITFDEQSDICLNPFDIVQDFDDEQDVLIGLLSAMISPTSKLQDIQIAKLREVLTGIWNVKGRHTTIDDIADALLNYKLASSSEEESFSHRISDMGHQLFAFTSNGPYGHYFSGKNNMQMNNPFVVLELEELKGKRALQQVVLLQLIYQIQQEVYLGERDKNKVLIIDEAWDLMKEGDIAYFMEHAYRRFRKYRASAVIITQLLNDLYGSDSGRVIAGNSATKFILMPEASDLALARKNGDLGISDGAFDQLATVTTVKGMYSEVFVLGDHRQGIGRLFVSDRQKLLYSTDGRDVNDIKRYSERGYTVMQSINNVLKDRGIYA